VSCSICNIIIKEKKDNYCTPKILVNIIIPYLKKYAGKSNTILCPFDTKNSEFVLGIREHFGESLKVEYSHIDIGKDFFTYTKEEVKKYCAIVSNPPFSKKLDIIKKLNELELPYALEKYTDKNNWNKLEISKFLNMSSNLKKTRTKTETLIFNYKVPQNENT
jgi:hypothetical protein